MSLYFIPTTFTLSIDYMGNRIKLLVSTILSESWGTLKKVKYQYLLKTGVWQTQEREVYDRGNGAVILLYNKDKGTVVLTSQLRIPTWFNGNTDGLMIEACAGMLDEKDPEACIIRETEEETGYKLSDVKKIMEVYMSPGSVTEILYFFTGAYSDSMKTGNGGGIETEHENIEVLEIPFHEALAMIDKGEIRDAKTIILLQYAQLNSLL